ncbi:MAG: MmcQ/YjbR family DNA-binding protein [Acidobacteriaceae bacterium]|nr:MmcQ/YjbR family DNA-binding protein [Acidobacteriaceae bacterium]
MLEWLRQYCLSLPHATECIQWGESLVFKVAGKCFAIAALEPRQYILSLKCNPDTFAEWLERPGVAPAPYLARAKWIALENDNGLTHAELKALVRESYDLVYAKLPKRVKAELN